MKGVIKVKKKKEADLGKEDVYKRQESIKQECLKQDYVLLIKMFLIF